MLHRLSIAIRLNNQRRANTLKLIAVNAHSTRPGLGGQNWVIPNCLTMIRPAQLNLENVHRIVLQFPKFTDGRAYSQAYLLRRRLGFKRRHSGHG